MGKIKYVHAKVMEPNDGRSAKVRTEWINAITRCGMHTHTRGHAVAGTRTRTSKCATQARVHAHAHTLTHVQASVLPIYLYIETRIVTFMPRMRLVAFRGASPQMSHAVTMTTCTFKCMSNT